MTPVGNKNSKKKTKESNNSKQPELPLVREHDTPAPQSKIIFQLKTELNRLQQRDREWKLMFNMLAHDLKEPILTLEGFTKLLDGGEVSPKDQKRYLKIVREAVHSLHMLVGSLQSVAKLYHDSPEQMSDISLQQLFQSVLASLSGQIEKTKGQIQLPEEDFILRGDPIRLYQIFLNLLANSLKYHRDDVPPQINIRWKKDPKFIRISIQDNGVGIDAQDMKKLFTPFTRLHDTSAEDGLGIGLSIVKRIAESFGGRVQVRSQQNVGTTFTVSLPRGENKASS